MDTLRQDISYALRRLGRAPGFAAIAILTLALGIGANSAIFSVVYGVLLKPLPFPESNELVRLYQVYRGENSVFSPPNFLDVQRMTQTLESVAAIDTTAVTVTHGNESERVESAEVSASFFDVFGVAPEFGRTLRPDDHAKGRTKVVVLSHGLWLQRLGGRPDAVGRRITIEGEPYEVVGVMPAGFEFPDEARLWLPFVYDEDFTVTNRGAWFLTVIGRLKPGTTVDAARSEMQALGARLEQQYPKDNTNVGMSAVPLHDSIVRPIRPALTILLGAVGAVLLIACVNVANLLLARSTGRAAEFAVRTALGARRGRLVQQLFTESVILAIAGALAGLLLSAWLTDLLIAAQPEEIPRLDEVAMSGAVLAFTAGVAVVTALLFGLFPAFQVTRGNLPGAIKDAGRSADAGTGSARLRRILVAAEVALALTLLVGAGLLIRSFAKLTAVDPGFASRQALTFRYALPERGYETDEQKTALLERATDVIRSVPGVTDAGATVGLPLTGVHFVLSFNVKGRPPRKPGEGETLEVRVVTPEYFRAIGLPVQRGRGFTAADRTGSEKVVMLSEAAVRRHFPGQEALGQYVELGWRRVAGGERIGGRVVGIVADAREHGLDEEVPPEIYVPHGQAPLQSMHFVVRTAVPPSSVAAAITERLRTLEPRAPVYRVRTLDELVRASVAEPRFYMVLLAGFAVLALLLACVGIFGVMSYAVAQRTREVGIRMALGANRTAVVGLVLRQALAPIAAGIAIGIALALALSGAMRNLLFEISPTDPLTIAGVALLLATVALLAGYLPARRATRVDPLLALRAE